MLGTIVTRYAEVPPSTFVREKRRITFSSISTDGRCLRQYPSIPRKPSPDTHEGSNTDPGEMVKAEMDLQGKPPTRRSTCQQKALMKFYNVCLNSIGLDCEPNNKRSQKTYLGNSAMLTRSSLCVITWQVLHVLEAVAGVKTGLQVLHLGRVILHHEHQVGLWVCVCAHVCMCMYLLAV